jgi:capsular polysaccharide transport system permease protein
LDRRSQSAQHEPLLGLDAAIARNDTAVALDAGGKGKRVLPAADRQGPLAADNSARKGTAVTGLASHGSLALRRIEQHLTVIPQQRAVPAERFTGPLDLPQPARPGAKRSYGSLIGFAVCVLLPTILAGVYFGFFASNQYVTEFRFSVQDTSSGATDATNNLLALAGASSGANSNDNYLVTDFLSSREAVDELQKRIHVESMYTKPGIDWWSRFNKSAPIESFVSYWQKMISTNYDQVTGIATASVRAFSPKDSLLIANTLVALSEQLINGIANRSQRDAVRFAKDEVEHAQDRLRGTRAQLTAYRDKYGVIDPTTSVAASNSTLIQTQRANLAQLETQLATFQSQKLAPNAPAIVNLKNQINSTKEQLAKTEADVGQGANGTALSNVVGQYEKLNLDLQFAQSMVTSTMQALAQARANAAAQHLYITPFVRPSLPQSSTYPRRLQSVILVGAMAFAFWLIGLLVLRSIRERFA